MVDLNRQRPLVLSNVQGQPGFDEFKSLTGRTDDELQKGTFFNFLPNRQTVSSIPPRPDDATLARIQFPFTESGEDAFLESLYQKVGGNPFEGDPKDVLDKIQAKKTDFINSFGEGHFTSLTLPNQPKEIQQAVESAFGKASSQMLKQEQDLNKARKDAINQALKFRNEQRQRFKAQRKKSESLTKDLAKSKETARKEIMSLRIKLTQRNISDGIEDGVPEMVQLGKDINARIDSLNKAFPDLDEKPETPDRPQLEDTPLGRERARVLRERDEVSEVQPTEQARFESAVNQARKELTNSGELDGLAFEASRRLIGQRAKQIFEGL